MECIKMKHTILVTGANGQLGNEMRRVAQNSTHEFIFTDVAELDITKLEDISELCKIRNVDIIVNCAAYTNVDAAEDNEAVADLINNVAVRNLAIVTKEINATLIHISTDYVFHGDKCIPYKESWDTNPLGIYGKTKLAGEQAIAAIGAKHIIFRTAWLYSKHGKNFVKTMQMLTSTKDSLKVVFDQVGTPTYAGDLADLIYHIIDTDQLDKQGIYHYSNEGVTSWYDFAKEICELSGNNCDIQPCHSDEFPSKVKRPHFSVLDKTKVKNTFGITVPYWKDSLRKCIAELSE